MDAELKFKVLEVARAIADTNNKLGMSADYEGTVNNPVFHLFTTLSKEDFGAYVLKQRQLHERQMALWHQLRKLKRNHVA